MADYNRYSVEPEDIPRRRRERKKKRAKSKSRVWLIVKLFIVALLLALIAGLAVAAGAIYALSRDLPSLDDLQKSPLAVNTTIYDRTGKVLIAELHGGENRVLVPTKKIPEVMKQATVAVEDERYYEHHGVDYLGVVRAMVENLAQAASSRAARPSPSSTSRTPTSTTSAPTRASCARPCSPAGSRTGGPRTRSSAPT